MPLYKIKSTDVQKAIEVLHDADVCIRPLKGAGDFILLKVSLCDAHKVELALHNAAVELWEIVTRNSSTGKSTNVVLKRTIVCDIENCFGDATEDEQF
ncbi:MAG: hypothetical protein A2Y07_01225 [Planctomycetes bacterium GWF2_50_10]|nr:MAG: hypothetical protein A2Y07_01225 [Planctomycetes bacterium GWF2_50_10]